MTDKLAEMIAVAGIDNSAWKERDNLRMLKRRHRVNSIHKTESLYELFNCCGGFILGAAYVNADCEASDIVGSGCYIKYVKNSNSKKVRKAKTTRRMRKHKDLPTQKGYYYRKLLGVYSMIVNHASKSPLARSFKASVTQEKVQRHGAKGHIKTLTQ